MTSIESYILSLIGMIIGSICIGFAICWPIARLIGYRYGCRATLHNILSDDEFDYDDDDTLDEQEIV